MGHNPAGARGSALSRVTLGDIVTAARRYQPVVIGVAILLVVFAVLPKPEGLADPRESAQSLLDQTRASSPQAPVGGAGDVGGVPPASPGVGAVVPSAFDATSSIDNPTTTPTTFDSPSSSSDLPTFSGPSLDSSTDETGAPLRIVGSTWATRQAGTPLAAEGVPAGTLPVGVRLTDDKLSFIRLAGDQTLLRLAEDPAGARSTNGPAIVQICQVTSDAWQDGEAVAFDAAPAWDAGECTLGTRGDDGVWTFDLQDFDAPADRRGFALVPGEGAGLDFQVAFKKTG